MAFIESPRFPDWIAFWARGGRGFKTTVVETYGGDEYRNAAWTQGKGEWIWDTQDAASFVNNPALAAYAYSVLRNLFGPALGAWGSFRFKDFKDCQDEGGGIFRMLTATTFQMYKRVSAGGQNYDQIVQKPTGLIVVTGGVSPVVDNTTGICTVASGTPTSWVGGYDIPVRFGVDMPQVGPDQSGSLINWEALKLIEIRNP